MFFKDLIISFFGENFFNMILITVFPFCFLMSVGVIMIPLSFLILYVHAWVCISFALINIYTVLTILWNFSINGNFFPFSSFFHKELNFCYLFFLIFSTYLFLNFVYLFERVCASSEGRGREEAVASHLSEWRTWGCIPGFWDHDLS